MINRQKLIEAVSKLPTITGNHASFVSKEQVLHTINSQPPADQWIPCSERLPGKEGRYLCFLGTGVMEVLKFTNDLYEVDEYDFSEHKGKAGFYTYDSEWGYSEADYIEAWARLPEPYKGAE